MSNIRFSNVKICSFSVSQHCELSTFFIIIIILFYIVLLKWLNNTKLFVSALMERKDETEITPSLLALCLWNQVTVEQNCL